MSDDEKMAEMEQNKPLRNMTLGEIRERMKTDGWDTIDIKTDFSGNVSAFLYSSRHGTGLTLSLDESFPDKAAIAKKMESMIEYHQSEIERRKKSLENLK
jgi:hypothetical protein